MNNKNRIVQANANSGTALAAPLHKRVLSLPGMNMPVCLVPLRPFCIESSYCPHFSSLTTSSDHFPETQKKI
jgi:hypothetical protein